MTISTDQFTVSKPNKTLITEISSINEKHTFIRLYPDACDIGFELISHVTGRSSKWYEDHYVYQDEGTEDQELAATVFLPTEDTLRKEPQLLGWSVHILND